MASVDSFFGASLHEKFTKIFMHYEKLAFNKRLIDFSSGLNFKLFVEPSIVYKQKKPFMLDLNRMK